LVPFALVLDELYLREAVATAIRDPPKRRSGR
jgi:hypothetical protein